MTMDDYRKLKKEIEGSGMSIRQYYVFFDIMIPPELGYQKSQPSDYKIFQLTIRISF